MPRIFALRIMALLLLSPSFVFARGETVRIEIQGANLDHPIHITDPKILAGINVWSGIGIRIPDPQFDPTEPSFVIDWSAPAAAPPKDLPRYEVSFYSYRPDLTMVYVVTYAFDPATGRGYVYLPGKGDTGYNLNVHSIIRGVEGKWFHAWSHWDAIAQPLLETHTKSKNAPHIAVSHLIPTYTSTTRFCGSRARSS